MRVGPTSLSVVIPCYNEARRLPATLESSIRYLSSDLDNPRRWEILVVDDGSDDETAVVVQQHRVGRRLRLLRSPCNHGKGAAVVQPHHHTILASFVSYVPLALFRLRVSLLLAESASW